MSGFWENSGAFYVPYKYGVYLPTNIYQPLKNLLTMNYYYLFIFIYLFIYLSAIGYYMWIVLRRPHRLRTYSVKS